MSDPHFGQEPPKLTGRDLLVCFYVMFLGQVDVKLDRILVENQHLCFRICCFLQCLEQLSLSKIWCHKPWTISDMFSSAHWHVSAWELKHNVSWLIFQNSLCFFICLVSCRKSGAEELVWKKQTHLPCQPLGALRSRKKMGQIHCKYLHCWNCHATCLDWIQVSKVPCSFMFSSRTKWKKLCELDVHDHDMV